MTRFALAHLDDHALLRDLAVHVTRNCAATADLLADLAEVDARKLYLPAAHPSMHSYCVHVLRLSEQSAFKRIRVARLGRECPSIFTAIAEGRVHLRCMVLLAPHMNPENAAELLEAATHKTCEEIESLLARRFPRPDLPARVRAMSPSIETAIDQFSTGTLQSGAADQLSPGRVDAFARRPRVTPLAPERFSVQFTVGQDTYETLRYAQALLGHQVPTGDIAAVFDRALQALVTDLEKTRFAATARPRAGRQRTSDNPRYVPTHVKRAVWARDGGQCGFVSDNGTRCPERSRLEFDHVIEVARGGEATIDGIRLRCRAHNQYEAERTFGASFMQNKRDEARRTATERRVAAAAQPGVHEVVAPGERVAAGCGVTEAVATERMATASVDTECVVTESVATAHVARECVAGESVSTEHVATGGQSGTERSAAEAERAAVAAQAMELDLMHCLKQLGFRADQVRLAIQHCGSDPDTPIEERARAALKFLGARGRTYALRQAVTRSSGAAGLAAGGRAAT